MARSQPPRLPVDPEDPREVVSLGDRVAVRVLVAARDAKVRAAALTGFGEQEDRRRALAAGLRMHLAKPLEANALLAAVATTRG